MGDFPNLKWDTVTPPDFLESYEKYPCAYMFVWSPIIFIASLLAPTVPSEPSPQNLHLTVPGADTFTTSGISKDLNTKDLYEEALKKLSLPIFIKPANNGSSIGISKVRNYDEFEKGLMEAFKYDRKVVLESNIEGFEIGCAVVGNEDLLIGEVDEIDTKNDFFDYVEKYSQHNSKIYCPARISDDLKAQAKDIAAKTYKALGCRGLSRVDMFLTPDNQIYLNEINTIPGLTGLSRYPSMLKKIGIEYKDLIVKLVDLAMEMSF
jgi:D-alanine---D-serine ligase